MPVSDDFRLFLAPLLSTLLADQHAMQQQSRSLWDATASSPSFEPLRGELSTEVVIIGAGITGLTAALLLAEKGRRVAVLEKETIGSGETGNTTAHLTVAIDAARNRTPQPAEARNQAP